MANLLDSLVIQELPTVSRSAQILAKSQHQAVTRANLKAIYTPQQASAGSPLGRAPADYGTRLQKSVMNALDGPDDSLERLAFERDPQRITEYAGIYRPKLQGVPDALLKRMAIQDDLVAAVVHTRSNHVAQFGRKQPDRHCKGFKFDIDKGVDEKLDENGKKKLQERIIRAEKLLTTCGHTNGWSEQEKCSFSEFLYMQARNAVVVGRMATEVVWTPDPDAPGDATRRKFHSFRPVDAGTVYFAAPYHEVNQQVRETALRMMENLHNEKLRKEKFENEEYAWVQVFEGRPMQAFGAQELLVHSPYQVTDIEQMGYPVTPLDTALTAVTTHINITHHNRLYFQTGRAARGMLIIKSADIDPDIVAGVKQQFNASINSVQNAWRMPVFGIGPEDELTWAPIDSGGGRDMEFQYLADANARTILAAFQMSPEELPGYQHLSRGTNNQALCLAKSSNVLTKSAGHETLGNVLGNGSEKAIEVWTGKKWCDARVFVTGARRRCYTTLSNGARLETSPDHRFRSVGSGGELVWVNQSLLVPGSTVLVSRISVDGVGEVPLYQGRRLTPDMMEVLGWLIGDGNINLRFNENTGNVKQGVLSWFYHHDKERDLWQRHSDILVEYGLGHRHLERIVGEHEKEDLKRRYGFKEVASSRITNRLYDTSFVKWMLSLGFRSSTDGKVIPAFVYTLPAEYRQAFLRGLFSADGTCVRANSAVRIVVHDDVLRQQTRDLLLTMGIRTQFHEGLKKQIVDGTERRMVAGASTLTIKDKTEFYRQVGFLQSHKQPDPEHLDSYECWDWVPPEIVRNLLGDVSGPNIRRICDSGCARTNLKTLLVRFGIAEPVWLGDYYFETVESVERTDEMVEMVDVEVFDSDHAFIANGIVVHNSEGNEEYKLTAARDVGIRPLLASFEDFLNSSIVPLIDPELAKVVKLKLVGLDIDTEEKESVRISQDMGVWMTFNDILRKLEKKPLPKKLAADIPLNPTYFQYLQFFVPYGTIMKELLGYEDGEDPQKHPDWQFTMNPFWQQQQQMVQQQQAMAQQAQQQQQGQSPPDQGGSPAQASPPAQDGGEDLSTGIDQLLQIVSKSENFLSKAERDMPVSKRKLRAQTIAANRAIMDSFARDTEHKVRRIAEIATEAIPAGKKG